MIDDISAQYDLALDDEMWIHEYSVDIEDQTIDFNLDHLPPRVKTQEELDIDAYNRAMSIL